MTRRIAVIVVLIVVIAGALWLSKRAGGPGTAKAIPPQGSAVASTPPTTSVSISPAVSVPNPAKSGSEPTVGKPAVSSDAAAESDLGRIATADALGSPGGSIGSDLTLLVTLFEDWRTFFPGDGNPWGDNAEITAALMGKNRRQLVFIDKTHRAINADGELCDRWGTPFRFHALSGDHMEIRSAGPDKKFGTADDAVVTPP